MTGPAMQVPVLADIDGHIRDGLQAVERRLPAAVDALHVMVVTMGAPRLGNPDLVIFHPNIIPEQEWSA